MSVRVMSLIFQATFEPIAVEGGTTVRPANQKLVLLAFADYASDTGESIYPSIATMLQKTGLSNGTLNCTIQALKAEGYLVPVNRKEKGNVEYNLNIDLISGRIPTLGKQDSNPRKPEIPTLGNESSVNHQLTKDIVLPAEKPGKVSKPELTAMVYAFQDVTRVDAKVSWGVLAKFAKPLVSAGYTPEQVRAVFGTGGAWYQSDWRGQKGQLPKPSQVAQELSVLLPKNEPAITQAKDGGYY